MRRILVLCLLGAVLFGLAGCSLSNDKEFVFDGSKQFSLNTREDGSGTKDAFLELFKIAEKNEQGQKVDNTVDWADITNSTSVMITSVEQNEYAIGYISLGSLSDKVKALKIDGAKASVENIKNGSYKISRPFNVVTKDNLSDVAQDFLNFILSEKGQSAVEKKGYIPVDTKDEYKGNMPFGKITIAGSSSVSPLMEILKEAYVTVNPNAQIEINTSDSTTGVNSVVDGICDIGMASRELKDSEVKKSVSSTTIALDGIVIIVNNKNPLSQATSENIKDIYTGKIETWADID